MFDYRFSEEAVSEKLRANASTVWSKFFPRFKYQIHLVPEAMQGHLQGHSNSLTPSPKLVPAGEHSDPIKLPFYLKVP